MYPPLPSPPPPPVANPGPRSPFQPPIQLPTTGGNIAEGIRSFIASYMGTKEKMKAEARSKFAEGIQQKLMGIPIDNMVLAKLAKKAGFEWDFENPTSLQEASAIDQQNKFKQSQDQYIQAQMLASQGAAPGLAPGVIQAAAAVPQPTPPPQTGITPGIHPPKTFWQNIKESVLGPGSSVGANSPAMAYMQRLTQMGQRNMLSEDKKSQINDNITTLTQGALTGDPKSTEILSMMGVLPKLSSTEELRLMAHRLYPNDPEKADQSVANLFWWSMSGGPQSKARLEESGLRQVEAGRFDKLADAVDAMTNPSSRVTPKITFDEKEKISNAAAKLTDTWAIPPMIAYQAAYKMVTDPEDAQNILRYISSNYETKEQHRQRTDLRDFNYRTTYDKEQMTMKEREMGQTWAIHKDNLGVATIKALDDVTGKSASLAWDMWQKAPNKTAKNEAVDMLISALNKRGSIQLPDGSRLNPSTVTRDNIWGLFSDTSWPKMNLPESMSKATAGTVGTSPGGQTYFDRLRELSKLVMKDWFGEAVEEPASTTNPKDMSDEEWTTRNQFLEGSPSPFSVGRLSRPDYLGIGAGMLPTPLGPAAGIGQSLGQLLRGRR